MSKADDYGRLYKFEVWEWVPEKNALEHHVSWEMADSAESLENQDPTILAFGDVMKTQARLATDDEVSAYEEGLVEGAMLADVRNNVEKYNGVTFNVTMLDTSDNPLAAYIVDFHAQKVFSCGVCGIQFDFIDAAMVGDYFITMSKDNDVLWYLCRKCAKC